MLSLVFAARVYFWTVVITLSEVKDCVFEIQYTISIATNQCEHIL